MIKKVTAFEYKGGIYKDEETALLEELEDLLLNRWYSSYGTIKAVKEKKDLIYNRRRIVQLLYDLGE